MPASLYGDMDHHGGGGLSMHHSQHSTNCSSGNTNCSVSSSNSGASLIDEDQRALQLALELSMLGLTDNTAALQLAASVADHQHHHQQQQLHHQQQQHLHHQQQQRELREQQQIHQQQQQIHHHNQANNSLNSPSDLYSSPSDMLPKKSQNMTECVPVPSSEHVAEIVGRQGMCHIHHISYLIFIRIIIFSPRFSTDRQSKAGGQMATDFVERGMPAPYILV